MAQNIQDSYLHRAYVLKGRNIHKQNKQVEYLAHEVMISFIVQTRAPLKVKAKI